MTYAQKDSSVADGAPVECYKFVSPLGTFRFTSDNRPVEMGGEIFEPLQITRTAIETGSLVDTIMTMDFIIPADHDLAKLFCYKVSPESLEVEVRRGHRGDDWANDYQIEWKGYGLGTSVSGDWATLSTGSVIQDRLRGNTASIVYQRMCNHILFDERCKVNRDDWTVSAIITKIQNQLITVDNDGFANEELKLGELVNVRSGERRGIYDNQNNIVTVSYPLIDVAVGDEVTLTLGCNRLRLGHCKLRFNNVANYGGFDFIPTVNPFVDLKPDALLKTKVDKEREYTQWTTKTEIR